MEIPASFYILFVSLFVAACLPLGLWVAARRLRSPFRWPPVLLMILWLAVLVFIPYPYFFSVELLLALWLARSNSGLALAKALHYQELILFQSFRIFLELSLMVGAAQGEVAMALTMQGANFDILVGLSAMVLAFYIPRFPNMRYVRGWNYFGILFLALVFLLGQKWGWPTARPYLVWPGFLFGAGLTGHLLILRKLSLDPKIALQGP